jgi:HK97 family phage prohead protease
MEGPKPDFQGYATKTGLKCTDGRTILPGAFQHQDKTSVPLLYMHGHKEPQNVLGHVDLEERPDGTYCYAFFNNTPNAQHMKEAVEHQDIKQMSIWANQLIERSKQVMHGVIREVSLVLAGANPGALIEPVQIEHSDGSIEERPDEIIMFGELVHVDDGAPADPPANPPADPPAGPDEATVKTVYETMDAEQKEVLHYMVGEALASSSADPAAHSGTEDPNNPATKSPPRPMFIPASPSELSPTSPRVSAPGSSPGVLKSLATSSRAPSATTEPPTKA